jgi:hypothetical protein
MFSLNYLQDATPLQLVEELLRIREEAKRIEAAHKALTEELAAAVRVYDSYDGRVVVPDGTGEFYYIEPSHKEGQLYVRNTRDMRPPAADPE